MADVRPLKATSEIKLLGKNVLVFLNYGEAATEAVPVWALLGGQRSADFSSSADEIDLTDKTSDGYGDADQGTKSTELSMELIVKPNDAAVKELYTAHNNGEAVDILRWAKDGKSIRNWYSITELSESASYDDAAILKVTLKGCGAPTFTDAMADPRA